uniref:Spermatosis associated 22 n=1 Tax=Sphenodon punctatus TaxID=8508 RepID=A0A8D0GQF4_SPHPU
MKRNLTESSVRSTAGCLPVPLFNQKKRNRIPLTSNPLKNEPSSSVTTHSFDFSPTSTGLQRDMGGRGRRSFTEEKNTSAKVWDRNEYMALGSRTDKVTITKSENTSNSLKTIHQPNLLGPHKTSQHIETAEAGQTYSSPAQWPVKSSATSEALQQLNLTCKFKSGIQQRKANGGEIDHTQEDKMFQLKLKEKDNSLRIISAVIESMKHWSQYTYKTALLFEVLGTLDSAVTPGSYGAKSFVLRDGKESVSCIFYEIDRELPRLIRGRVHRCMGNYDTKKNIFKCVSVRPAIVTEQKTFQEFVKIADMEMREYVKTMNEV